MEFHPLANAAQVSGSAAEPVAAAAAASSPALGSWHTHPALPDRSVQSTRFRLTAEQLSSYDRDGYLLIKAKDVWTPAELKLMVSSVNSMNEWPDKAGAYMKYYESNRNNPDADKLLCRIENFTQYNPGLEFLLNGDKLLEMSSDLLSEPAIMYKEKVNYKLPGGAGFAPHQDIAAGWWMYQQSIHISCLVSIDPATAENGALEVVSGKHMDGMLSEDWKEIPLDLVEKMKWELVPTEPGDVLFFDSYVPHRSAPNNTNNSRRVLYVTYAKASEGDLRARYYSDKRASFPPDIERDPSKKYEYKI
jgi:hypothetical protein